MIIAGDIGGTKTNLALFDEKGNMSQPMTFHSGEHDSLRSIVKEYLTHIDASQVTAAAFAIAGPVKDGVCKATNLPWVVDAKVIENECGLPSVFLLNDLEANAYALAILPPESLTTLHAGQPAPGNQAVVSPGTGLGEAGLFWDGKSHRPFACEGGHTEFGPRDELQIELCRYLIERFGHASYERILSGPGLYNLYQFFREVKRREEPSWLTEAFASQDPGAVITQNALNGKSETCNDVLTLFCSILGSETGNCALKYMTFGGLFLGGGIPPKILPKLKEPHFYEGFVDKGRFREMLSHMPIHIILDDKAALKGAAQFCAGSLSKREASPFHPH